MAAVIVSAVFIGLGIVLVKYGVEAIIAGLTILLIWAGLKKD